ncbi:MAG: bifunctional glutamate N-acetyltransferase/amino-acid acetyltransferase ArgJ [Planktomarina sp.]
MTISPLAPTSIPILRDIAGVKIATAAAGIKYKNRDDVLLVELADGTSVAGVFTKSATCSAAVTDCRAKLGNTEGPAAILVNSGNANAFTGNAGTQAVETLCSDVATQLQCDAGRVFTASTGVIGEVLPYSKITDKLTDLQTTLGTASLQDAATAIMTTDTFAKVATRSVIIDGQTIQISGVAKGSGMIMPDMATMLAYVFTDAKVDVAHLQSLTATLCDRTFNSITVDSDTSTSDSLMVCATGASNVDATDNEDFAKTLNDVLQDLALQIVRDGEGATKLVTINVAGAVNEDDAKKVGLSIANSPLVKTAIAGEDPNWGRIVMAVGKSGAKANRDSLAISFGDISVAKNGWVDVDYREEDGANYMKKDELAINVDLGVGSSSWRVWTCDLTHEYITINADYRS